MCSLDSSYHPQLVQTLGKWSSKIQAVAPAVLLPSNKGTFSKGKQNLKSAVQLVDESLVEHSKLLTRTQLRRTPGTRIGSETGEDAQGKEEPEVFDDHDFYQKMLRAIIDSRGDGKGSSDDWLAIQKQKKAKKNVDTKASKGRKLRYVMPGTTHRSLGSFVLGTTSMKKYRTSWCLSRSLVAGTTSRLTSCSRHYSGKGSKMSGATWRLRSST